MRPWIAMVAAHALALQLILTGMLAGRVIAADNISSDSQFAICHSGGDSPDESDQGGAGKPPHDQTHCVLCVLASGSSAILPAGPASVVAIVEIVSDAAPRDDDRISEYHSPTGQYPRGPPTAIASVG